MITKFKYIKEMIEPSTELVNKQFQLMDNIKINILFLKNMTNIELINNLIIKPLVTFKNNDSKVVVLEKYLEQLKKCNKNKLCNRNSPEQLSHKVKKIEKLEFPKNSLSEYLSTSVIYVSETEYINDNNKLLDEILRGNCLVMINEGIETFSCSTVKYNERAISEPPTSVVINGPRAGFVENINTNITLLRRRVCNSDLKVEDFFVGRYTKTRISVCYISSIANKEIVKNVKKKINAMDIDGIVDSEYLVDILSKRTYSILKQVGKSEKPDVAVAKMLEGRVIILVDGSPICLSVPFIFLEDLQASDDYYQKNYRVILLRFLRLVGSFTAILLPAVYVAMQSFHYKLLPTKFLVTILNSTQGIPLTPFMEVLFVILLFEILYESSIRMPKYMGMALSIVGALILGDTAVKAGLVSSPSVMIIALSGITIYTVPDEAGELSLLRLFFVFLGGTLGLFGVSIGMLMFIVYACSIDSYGAPYFAPISPLIKSDLKDTFNKAVNLEMTKRPKSLKLKNNKRIKNKSNVVNDDNDWQDDNSKTKK